MRAYKETFYEYIQHGTGGCVGTEHLFKIEPTDLKHADEKNTKCIWSSNIEKDDLMCMF